MSSQQKRARAEAAEGAIARLRTTYQYLLGQRPSPQVSSAVGRDLLKQVASEAIRQHLVANGQLAASLELVVGTLGEASVRLEGDKVLITRSKAWFARLSEDDLIIASTNPGWLFETQSLPVNWNWHRVIYSALPQTRAVLFGQPAAATAIASSDRFPKASMSVGKVTPCNTDETTMSEIAAACEVILIENCGVLARGKDMEQAIQRMETINRWSEIALMSNR